MRESILLFITILLFSLTATVHAQKTQDYPLTVQVYRTGEIYLGEGSGFSNLRLDVTIEGQKLTLASTSAAKTVSSKGGLAVMKTGSYKAKILKEHQINAAQYTRRYEFLLSDEKKLEFDVIGESEN